MKYRDTRAMRASRESRGLQLVIGHHRSSLLRVQPDAIAFTLPQVEEEPLGPCYAMAGPLPSQDLMDCATLLISYDIKNQSKPFKT